MRDGLLRLHVLREGDGARTPLVLLHAFPVDRRMWRHVVDLLPGDRVVLAPDLPGFGDSPSGPDVAATVGADDAPSVDTMADGVAATLRAAGVERAVVAGLSLGGYVALALLERHRELVAGLALVDTRASADDDAARARRLAMVEAVEASGTIEPALGMRSALLGATNRTARPDLVARLEGWIRDQGPQGLVWAQRAMAARPDRTAVLRAYDGPAVVVVGEEDEISPPDVARGMAEDLGAPLVVVPGAGHMTSIESPEPVAAALSELAGRVDAG